MKLLRSLIFILLVITTMAYGQTNPPYPFVDDGTNIQLRNSGSRNVIFNTNFKVNITGGIEESDSTGLRLLPYSTIAGGTTELRFYELAANGSNYVGFKSPDTLAGSLVLTLPSADAIGTQCLSSAGTGVLGWSNCSGGTGTPGGSNTQVQYNNSGTFGGSSAFTFNAGTGAITVTSVIATTGTFATPLGIASGGTAASSFTLNGVVYGNNTAALLSTGQGAANTVLTANAGAPSFSGQPVLATGIITLGQDAVELRPSGVNPGEVRFLELAINGTNYVGFKAPVAIAGNILWSLPTTDSTGVQCLASDGNATLSWSACSGGAGTPGGSTTQVQYNASGSFAGNAGFTFTVGSATATITNLVLTNPLPESSGGTGFASATAGGVVYGNGASALQVTAQGGVNSVLTANAGNPSFSSQPTLNVGIITKGQVAVRLDPYGVAGGNTGEVRFLELAANGTNYAALKAPDSLAASLTWTLPVVDSTGIQCLVSNGSGILSWAVCGVTLGGSNTQIQFNNNGAFGGSAGLTWNGTTFLATNVTATNAIVVSSGGTGAATFTANGVLYGNGASPILVTAQGGANTVLIANNSAPSFSGQPSLSTGIKTFGQDAVDVNPFGVSSGNTGEIRFLELVANGVNYVGFKASDSLAGNVIWTLPIADSTGTQCISSNGSGILAWSACSGGTGTPGGANTQLQYNNAASFGGSSKMTFDGTTTTIDTLTITNTFLADASTLKVDSSTHSVLFGLAGTRTALLKLGGVTSGTISLTTAAAAGTYTLTLPITAGTVSQSLITDGTGILSWANTATDTNTLTFTNKRITKRFITVADATSITPTGDTADINRQVNTQAAGNFTVNAPSGTPTNGQCIWVRMSSTFPQTYVFNAIYRFSTDLPAPTTSTGSGRTDYLMFCYNVEAARWDYMAKNFGF